ncbi:glycosyltransferase 87 family protein [Streptomyces sp. NBC_01361]|uniref:glycosyltransferase 87 family protein n=1 Tax=Streptomyces sp. NBC_01361 TaxID=2903838 RepID=UPI002E3312AD|nr:glycosyltransferase 87 family protein [Streptomyces sp. NBC_01361]
MLDTAAEEPRRHIADSTMLALAAYTTVMVALLVRTLLLPSESTDYLTFLDPWYQHIAGNGGFTALADPGFSDYNVPYLYLLAALTYIPVSPLAGIKWISILFDLALAYYTFRIVSRLRPTAPSAALGAAAVVLFLPTVVTNSGWWGQCDGIYTAFLVGGIHYVLRHRPWWACTFFGLALAFKFQAVFLFPFLLVLVLVRRVPWRCLLAVPTAYLVLDVPALVFGADPGRLLTVYARQTDTYRFLTVNGPSVYQFVSVPGDAADAVRSAGVLVAGALVSLLIGLAVWSLRRGRHGVPDSGRGVPALTDTRIVLLATCSAIVVPFLLPSMHERYFYAADVLTVMAAFQLPRQLWYVPVLVQLASFGSYLYCVAPGLAPYLSMPAHGALMLLALVAMLRTTIHEFRHGPEAPAVRDRPSLSGNTAEPTRT